MTRRGVLDVGDGTADVGLQGAVLEGTVARRVEGTVLQHQVVGIAQRLFTGDVAIDQAQVFECQPRYSPFSSES